jgi:hypothetical protein
VPWAIPPVANLRGRAGLRESPGPPSFDGMTAPTPPEGAGAEGAPSAPPPRRKRWWHRWKLILAGVVVTPLLLVVLYTYMTLNWSYSDGERSGTLIKFSKKGWLCKTWEGELMQPTAPGVAPTIWYFSVRDEATADQVTAGVGKRVVLYYSEHRGIPTDCFGETDYFVRGIRVEE